MRAWVLHRKYWVEQVSYGLGDDIRNVVMSDCVLIIYLVAFFGFTNNLLNVSWYRPLLDMFGAFIVLSVFPIGWRRKYQGEQVLVKGQLYMGDVKNLVMADHVLIVYWVALLSVSLSVSVSLSLSLSLKI